MWVWWDVSPWSRASGSASLEVPLVLHRAACAAALAASALHCSCSSAPVSPAQPEPSFQCPMHSADSLKLLETTHKTFI